MAEAFWLPGSTDRGLKSATLARRPMRDPEILNPIIKQRTPLFRTFSEKGGLMGHIAGKAMLRGGVPDVYFRIHTHQRLLEPGQYASLHNVKGDLTLLHFDALSYDIWCEKHIRRLQRETAIGGNSAQRNAQSEMFGYCTDEDGRARLFEAFYGSSFEYLRALQQAGCLIRLTDEPVTA